MPRLTDIIKYNLINFVNSVLSFNYEKKNLIRFISSLNLASDQVILDVGCGYGRNYKLLSSFGKKILGVELNPDIVQANIEAGLECMTVTDFAQTTELYDVLLLSHVIEHFQPNDLIVFMDNYLSRLKSGGYLIIATPLFTSHFYEDFDHIKPYHPTGFNMVFGNTNAQVQYYSQNKIQLIDIWFRRRPFKWLFYRGLYLGGQNKTPIIINLVFAILFHATFGLIGRTNGWMGLYKKL